MRYACRYLLSVCSPVISLSNPVSMDVAETICVMACQAGAWILGPPLSVATAVYEVPPGAGCVPTERPTEQAR